MPRTAEPLRAWFRLGWDIWVLGADSFSVIALRTAKLAAGGEAAEAEARRMVVEKVAAGLAVTQRAWTGQLGVTLPGIASGVVADFRRTVRANKRRLTNG